MGGRKNRKHSKNKRLDVLFKNIEKEKVQKDLNTIKKLTHQSIKEKSKPKLRLKK